MQVLIDIPEVIYRRAEQLAQMTGRDIQDILAMHLFDLLPPLLSELDARPVELLSDEEVIALSESTMEPQYDMQMSTLLQKQQAGVMSDIEQATLKLLFENFEAGQLRKTQALVQAVKRGLREPLNHGNY